MCMSHIHYYITIKEKCLLPQNKIFFTKCPTSKDAFKACQGETFMNIIIKMWLTQSNKVTFEQSC